LDYSFISLRTLKVPFI